MIPRPRLLRPTHPPARQLQTVSDQLDAFAAEGLVLSPPDMVTLAATLRDIARQLPSGRPAPVLRLVVGGQRA